MLGGGVMSRQDRAKMDVWVTSKWRGSPSLEWSKGTDRSSPIQGMGRPVDASLRPRIDPQRSQTAVDKNVPSIDMRLSSGLGPRDPQYRRQSDVRPYRAPEISTDEFRQGKTLPPEQLDFLSTNARSTKCAVSMGRGPGATPKNKRRERERARLEEEEKKAKEKQEEEFAGLDINTPPGMQDLLASPGSGPPVQVAQEEPEEKEEQADVKTQEEPMQGKPRRRRRRDMDETEGRSLLRWPEDTGLNHGGGGNRRGGMTRHWGIDISRMSGREQFDMRKQKKLEFDYSPSVAFTSKHSRCRGGNFYLSTGRTMVIKQGGKIYDKNWDSIDAHVKGPSFNRGPRDRGAPADQYGIPHEMLRPLQSKWSGTTEKLRGWHERSFRAVNFSPASCAAPQSRARSPDVGGALKSADASLEMVRNELSTHRAERRRRKEERSELYSEDRGGRLGECRLADRDPAASPGFRLAYAHCDTPPVSPGPTPPRAASAPLGAAAAAI